MTENVIVNVFPANYKSVQPTYNLEIDWGEEDPSTITNYTENEKQMTKRKISTDVNQARITHYFTAKKPRMNVDVEIPQMLFEPLNVEKTVINCFCGLPAFKNYATSKPKHIKNFGRPYYYCSKKLAKPVGVKRSSVSATDLEVYDSACTFFLRAEPV